jgi:hypothetical protein
MTHKSESDIHQIASSITNIIDMDDDEESKKATKKAREAYRHITIRGVASLVLLSFLVGGITSCSVINFSVMRYHDLTLERDMIQKKHIDSVLTANQNSLDAMRDSLEKMAVNNMASWQYDYSDTQEK